MTSAMRYVEMTRREFLAAGAAAVGGAAVGVDRTWGDTGNLSILGSDFHLAPIGLIFVEEALPSSGRLLQRIADLSTKSFDCPGLQIADANSFPEGSFEFVDKGLRLTVWGAVPKTSQDVPDAIDVEVLFDPYHPNRFRAWSFRKNPVWSEQSPCRLSVPIDPINGLNLGVSMRWGPATKEDGTVSAQRERLGRVRLAVASEVGAPKLLRGVYVIPLSDSGRYELNRLSKGKPLSEAASPVLLLETGYVDSHANSVA